MGGWVQFMCFSLAASAFCWVVSPSVIGCSETEGHHLLHHLLMRRDHLDLLIPRGCDARALVKATQEEFGERQELLSRNLETWSHILQ